MIGQEHHVGVRRLGDVGEEVHEGKRGRGGAGGRRYIQGQGAKAPVEGSSPRDITAL
jgi:hypothetical protein